MPAVSLPFIINFLTAILVALMGFFVAHKGGQNPVRKLFGLITLFIISWITTSALSDIVQDEQLTLVLADLALFGPFLTQALMYVLAHRFPPERKPLGRTASLLLFAPILASIPFAFSPLNIAGISRESWGTNFEPGPLYFVLFAYIVVVFAFSWRELAIKYRSTTDRQTRAQIRFLFMGFTGMFGFGLLMNLILPLFGYARASTIGPASSLFFVVFATYAIVRHHLLDLKVVAAELFGALITLVTFVQIFESQSVGEYVFHVALFLVTAVLALFLVRSVTNEVRRREEVQRLASELAVSNKRLRKLDDLKTTMVSIASHQIRGPLGGIRGYLTMFRDGDLGALTGKQKEIVTLNLNVTTRLLNAVETFLDITKLESGALTLRKEVLPLDDAVTDVVEEFRLPAEKKGISLSLAFECDRPIWVEFDPEKIKHVIFNLIDNALKYTEKGSIATRVRCDGREAVFEVTDTGMGILPEDAPKLFGKYQRGELVIDRGGSGLGLYVVKMLTEMQGGRIWASSPGVGKGSTFGFALPLSKRL